MSWIVFTGEGLSPVRSRDGELFRRRQVSSSSNMVGATRLLLADLAAHGEARAAEVLASLPAEIPKTEHAPNAAAGSCRVAVAVCTAKRPGMLRLCLQSIASQIVAAQIAIEIVVVDNEGAPNNATVVQEIAARCRFPVHYVHEPRRGIPPARNAPGKLPFVRPPVEYRGDANPHSS